MTAAAPPPARPAFTSPVAATAAAGVWAILPAAHDELAERCSGLLATDDYETRGETWMEFCEKLADEAYGASFDAATGILVQPVRGVIARGADAEEEAFYGLFDAQRIDEAAALAATEGRVRALVLHMDSPGGYTAGMGITLGALADLRAARPDLPVTAFVDGMACSLCYIFAAACEEIHCSPAAVLGSIGVYAVTTDFSKMFKEAGIDRQLHADGKYKGMGTFGVEWTEDWYAAVKGHVAETSRRIRAHVTAARPGVTEDDMQGQSWDIADAPAALHDGIAARSLDDYLAAIAAGL